MLRVRVLGAAAGGGLPQWNCACACCAAARSGSRGVSPQTQSSIAVSADGEHWVLLNASPDLRQQLEAAPALHPRRAPRHTPIGAVVLTNADVDHVAGLLTLRERQPFALYATPKVQQILAANPIFGVLAADCVERRELKLDETVHVLGAHGRRADGSGADGSGAAASPAAGSHANGSGALALRLFAVPGKVPLYLEEQGRTPDTEAIAEDTVAAEIWHPESDARLFYVPGCAALPEWLCARLRGAALVLFDGTVYRDDEMSSQHLGPKTGARMGHLAMSGPGGTLARFADLGVARKVFIHLNNSNPVWLRDSRERAAIEAAGWEVAHDGMELEL